VSIEVIVIYSVNVHLTILLLLTHFRWSVCHLWTMSEWFQDTNICFQHTVQPSFRFL